MNKLWIISLLVGMVLVAGCSEPTLRTQPPFEFENSGSNITNYKICYEHAQEICERNRYCVGVGVSLDEIICEGDRCMC